MGSSLGVRLALGRRGRLALDEAGQVRARRAADDGGEVLQVDKAVGLAAQVVGGCDFTVETTVTRTPFDCTVSTSLRKSPSPENSTTWSTCGAISIMSTAISTSMSPRQRLRPWLSVYSRAVLVTSE